MQEQLQELSESEQLHVQVPVEQSQSAQVQVISSVEFFMMHRFVSLLTDQQVKRRKISRKTFSPATSE
ncbi:MAG: hypothetical protein ACI84C_001489 [Flavobacteriales bacterium]